MKAEITFEKKVHRLDAGGLKSIKEKVRCVIEGREEKVLAIRLYEEVTVDYQMNFNKSDKFKNWEV